MRKYRLFINGQNYYMNLDGKPRKIGFYTTRYIEAHDPKKAEDIAVDLIKGDEKLRQAILNEKSDPPIIYVEEVEELESFGDATIPGTGYSFYPNPQNLDLISMNAEIKDLHFLIDDLVDATNRNQTLLDEITSINRNGLIGSIS